MTSVGFLRVLFELLIRQYQLLDTKLDRKEIYQNSLPQVVTTLIKERHGLKILVDKLRDDLSATGEDLKQGARGATTGLASVNRAGVNKQHETGVDETIYCQ